MTQMPYTIAGHPYASKILIPGQLRPGGAHEWWSVLWDHKTLSIVRWIFQSIGLEDSPEPSLDNIRRTRITFIPSPSSKMSTSEFLGKPGRSYVFIEQKIKHSETGAQAEIPADETREFEPPPESPPTTTDLVEAILKACRCIHGHPMYSLEHLDRTCEAAFGGVTKDNLPVPEGDLDEKASQKPVPPLNFSPFFSRDSNDSSGCTYPSDVSAFWSDDDDLDVPYPFLSPSPAPPTPGLPFSLSDEHHKINVPDGDREDYTLSEEKCLEADAYLGPMVYTTHDWWLYAEVAGSYATYIPERRITGPPPLRLSRRGRSLPPF